MTISIRLPEETERRLTALAERTGRPRAYYVREAIAAHLEDMEDIYLGEAALEDVRAGRDRTHSLEDVERDLGMDG